MTDNRLKQRIASAFDALTPETRFEDIRTQVASAPERRQVTMTVIRPKTNRFAKTALSAVAACLLLAAGLFGGIYYSNNIAVDSVIDIDVNPAIELTTNRNDRVLTAEAVNADGADILDGMDLTKSDLKVAVNALIGSMVQKGYVVDDTSGILVSVQNKSEQKAQTIRAEVLADIDDSLGQYNIPAPVINQTVTDTSSARELAEAEGISLGKAVFIKNLVAKDATLNEKELAPLTITQLAKLVVERNLDIRDVADYDADDSIWENIADSIEDVDEDDEDDEDDRHVTTAKPTTTAAETTAAPTQVKTTAATSAPTTAVVSLTTEQAKAKALAHAGLTADEVTFTKAKLERDDGVTFFDIEFRKGNVEYDYEIHHTSGKVLEWDKETDDDTPAATKRKTTTTATAKPTFSVEPLKAAALAHAGVSADEATFTKVEYDREDGTAHYDIEFRVGNVEYEYEIDADGKVLSWDKDVDDDAPVTTRRKTTTSSALISTRKAKSIALNHAGLTSDQVTRLTAERDRDDGVTYYEVEFRVGNAEYSYEIDAVSGEILDWEKEIDD